MTVLNRFPETVPYTIYFSRLPVVHAGNIDSMKGEEKQCGVSALK